MHHYFYHTETPIFRMFSSYTAPVSGAFEQKRAEMVMLFNMAGALFLQHKNGIDVENFFFVEGI